MFTSIFLMLFAALDCFGQDQKLVKQLSEVVEKLDKAGISKKITSHNKNSWMLSNPNEARGHAAGLRERGLSDPTKSIEGYAKFLKGSFEKLHKRDAVLNYKALREAANAGEAITFEKLKADLGYGPNPNVDICLNEYERTLFHEKDKNRSKRSVLYYMYFFRLNPTTGQIVNPPSDEDVTLTEKAMKKAGIALGFSEVKKIGPMGTDSFHHDRGEKRDLKNMQFHSYSLLHEVAFQKYKELNDAAAVVVITPDDMYPDADLNFVYGHADFLLGLVAVSTKRLLSDGVTLQKKGQRMEKILMHELSHTFDIEHCESNECVLNGYNGPQDLDNAPATFCPLSMAKVWYKRKYDQKAQKAWVKSMIDNSKGDEQIYWKKVKKVLGH